MFAFFKSILGGIQRPRMPDEYFVAATEGKSGHFFFFVAEILQVSVLTGPFYTHLANNPDVEPTLPLHRWALPSSAARWLDTGLYIWKNSSTST